MGLGLQRSPHCGKRVNTLPMNVTLRLWWQPEETGTFHSPPNTTARTLCQKGLPLWPTWPSRHPPANQRLPLFLSFCRLPATSRKLASGMGTRALIAGPPYFWPFPGLTFSPNSLPAPGERRGAGGLLWEGGLLPCLPARRRAGGNTAIGWRAAPPALVFCPGFPHSSAPQPALLQEGGLFCHAGSCEERKIWVFFFFFFSWGN